MTVLNSGGVIGRSDLVVSAALVLLAGCAGASPFTYQCALARYKALARADEAAFELGDSIAMMMDGPVNLNGSWMGSGRARDRSETRNPLALRGIEEAA